MGDGKRKDDSNAQGVSNDVEATHVSVPGPVVPAVEAQADATTTNAEPHDKASMPHDAPPQLPTTTVVCYLRKDEEGAVYTVLRDVTTTPGTTSRVAKITLLHSASSAGGGEKWWVDASEDEVEFTREGLRTTKEGIEEGRRAVKVLGMRYA